MNSHFLQDRADSMRERLESFFRGLDWKIVIVLFILVSLVLLLVHTFQFMTLMGL